VPGAADPAVNQSRREAYNVRAIDNLRSNGIERNTRS
jgi:hypothetical protein